MAFNFNWKPQDLSYQQYQFLSNPDEAFKNRTNTKQAQEMLGFEGNGIDGVAGKATRDAYNKQMRYYNDLYGNVSKAGSLDLNDPNAFYNDIHDAETYGFTPQEAENELNADILAEKQQQEAAAKEQQIANIESKIATLEKRIADNTAKLKNWNGGDVANKVAALEARKFFSQDPTSIWRWKAGMDAQKAQRAEDLERIEKEKKLTEEKNLKINRNKIDNILQTTIPTQNMTRDKMDMAVKQLNDAEELAKNYGDTDALKKINERKNELGIYVPVDDEANIIESDFVKNMEMVGKKGGMNNKQFAQYVQSVLDDPKNKHIWHYSPELQRKLYTAIGKNTGAKPTNYAGY